MNNQMFNYFVCSPCAHFLNITFDLSLQSDNTLLLNLDFHRTVT